MYEKCIKCERLGKDCIPNLYVMSVLEIRDWARKLKDEKGWTNAYLSEVSGVPKGTIDSNFSKRGGKCADVNYSTFSPVLCALLECPTAEMPCCKKTDECAYKKMVELEAENDRLQKNMNDMEKIMESKEKEFENRVEYLKEHIRWKQKIIITLIVISCILLFFILIGLMIDWMDSGIGFFWR